MRERRSIRRIVWWVLRLLNLSLIFCVAAIGGVVVGTYTGIAKVIPRARELGDIRPGLASKVLSAEGAVLATVSTQNREFVPLEEIPQQLHDAVVATEDRDFYRHIGINPRAIIRAALQDVISMERRQGASTITQQLARDVYLTQSKTMARKLAEAVLAIQLERAYTKPEIMELYLNQIYFGEGAYGVQVAAKTYFGKRVKDLTLAECALLAGLPKRPEYYSPFKDEQRAKERRNLVLSLMLEQGFITREQYDKAREEPLRLRAERRPLGLSSYEAPYFTNYVLRRVAAKYGAQALYQGGLTIHTTLNLEMQRAAEEAVKWGLATAKARHYYVDQAALVAVDVRTGAVKAMVGGADWSKSQYNRAVQGGRQAGSAFKPFVYAAALEQGYTPDSMVNDAPISFPGRAGATWSPKNYDGKYHGPVTFRTALAKSLNVCAVRVADRIGIGAVIDVAERMGIYHQMESYLPLAIGYCDVSPLEMASAYAVFANHGMRTDPYVVEKIIDARGRLIEQHSVTTWRALDRQVADQMRDMLRSVVTSGTGAVINRQVPFPAMGKTGTSNDYKDAWFVGFSDDLCAAVWMGNDEFKSTAYKGNPHGKGISGATIPAPVWARFMAKAQPLMASVGKQERTARIVEIRPTDQGVGKTPRPGDEPEPPAGPEGGSASEQTSGEQIVTRVICPTSGLLAGPYCPPGVEVTYDLSSGAVPPTKVCDVHTSPESGAPESGQQPRPPAPPRRPASSKKVTLSICRITGKLATPYCPIVVERTFDADEAPTETCTQHGRRPPVP